MILLERRRPEELLGIGFRLMLSFSLLECGSTVEMQIVEPVILPDMGTHWGRSAEVCWVYFGRELEKVLGNDAL